DPGWPFRHLDEPVPLQPQQDGVNRALDDVSEAELVQPARDRVPVGLLGADDFQHAALERALEHLGQVVHRPSSSAVPVLRNTEYRYTVSQSSGPAASWPRAVPVACQRLLAGCP